jgi:hypothetical protein
MLNAKLVDNALKTFAIGMSVAGIAYVIGLALKALV